MGIFHLYSSPSEPISHGVDPANRRAIRVRAARGRYRVPGPRRNPRAG
ncbi:MAG: hypothetical protein AVDCRST_MAG89-1558 [uncultured Gemmatimonadetes bacterium]|uniref:Uncharacterized protein n=1 Tax=uncultured Gemmatimonadota bacterium TaxID=203437 RepID=A0A6J4KYJ1_9BACT|nr:MAG: hypothetical protein AVDCRST_MAG89-1558 [uncultured Gemmatimonadota bacterium]